MKYSIIITSLLLLTSVFSFAEEDGTPAMSIKEKLRGNWGDDRESCSSDPIRISFSSDGKHMYHDTNQGLMMSDNSEPNQRLVYRILYEHEHFIRTEIIGEDRLTEDGKVVKWDLLFIDRNSFCWHRSDWGEMCTAPLISCDRLP